MAAEQNMMQSYANLKNIGPKAIESFKGSQLNAFSP